MRQQTTTNVQGIIPGQVEDSYRLEEGAQIHIMRILRNMYEDPMKAVLREFLANALDAHREQGIDKPIDIDLPTDLNPNLVVRDYGKGLSEKEFRKYILGYGATGDYKFVNKDQIGGFGIGCKSFFAVSSTAIFTLYYNGTKTVWLCQPDERDKGTSKRLSEEDTDEPNGVKIEIPIDMTKYTSQTIKNKMEYLLSYLKYPVNLNGVLISNPTDHYIGSPEMDFKLGDNERMCIYSYAGRQYVDSQYKVIVTINGIPYPLNSKFFIQVCIDKYGEAAESFLKILFRHSRLVLDVKDGFFELNPSRESFIENSWTGDACVKVYSELQDKLNKAAEHKLKTCDSAKECLSTAIDLYVKGLYVGFSSSYVKDCLDDKITYKNGTTCLRDLAFIPFQSFEEWGKSAKYTDVWLAGMGSKRNRGYFTYSYSDESTQLIPMTCGDGVLYREPFSNISGLKTSIASSLELDEIKKFLNEESYKEMLVLYWDARRGLYTSSIDPKETKDYHGILSLNKIRVYTVPEGKDPHYWASRFIKNEEAPPCLIVKGDKTKADKLINKFGDKLTYGGDLTKIVKHSSSSSGSTSKKKRKKTSTTSSTWFTFNETYFSSLFSVWGRANSKYWDPAIKPEGKYIYVVIDKFEPMHTSNSQLKDGIDTLKALFKHKQSILENVYAVKLRNRKKVEDDPNGKSFDEFYDETIKEWVSETKSNKFTLSVFQFLFINHRESSSYKDDLDNSLYKFLYNLETSEFSDLISRMFPYKSHIMRVLQKEYRSIAHVSRQLHQKLENKRTRDIFPSLKTHSIRIMPEFDKDAYDKHLARWNSLITLIEERYMLLYKIMRHLNTGQYYMSKDGARNTLKYIRAMDREENRKIS